MHLANSTLGELVLLGGGHAQVAVLRQFAMSPLRVAADAGYARDTHRLLWHVARICRRQMVRPGFSH